MRQRVMWIGYLALLALSLSLQSCLGIAESPFQSKAIGKNGEVNINTEQAAFRGKIYLTLDRNLYVLNDKKQLTQLTRGMDVRDPAISPNGKMLAFIVSYQDYSDLALMPATGGKARILLSGNGAYESNYPYDTPKSSYHWFAQPEWAADDEHLLFLSDLEKFYPRKIGVDSFLLDLMAFEIDIRHPDPAQAQEVAYSTYGDGGLRDAQYRPNHADQVVYTSYSYDAATQSQQVVQINLEDANAIEEDAVEHPDNRQYRPGTMQIESDPGVPLTPDQPVPITNMEPAFSPDGDTLVYVRREDASHMSLYDMAVPDDVTSVANPNDAANLEKGLVPYSKAVRLVTGQYVSQPVWSPDGRQIAYYSYSNDTFDLWLAQVVQIGETHTYRLKISGLTQLTDTHGDLDADSRICWAED